MVSKPADKPTAMTHSKKGDRERTQLAIQALLSRGGYKALKNSENATTVQETGNVVRDKYRLVGVPHYIVHVDRKISKRYFDEETGQAIPWVTITAILYTDKVVFYSDGSTGIARQLMGLECSPEKPIDVPEGLIVSDDYTYTDKHGNQSKGTPIFRLSGARDADIEGLAPGKEERARGVVAQNGRTLRA